MKKILIGLTLFLAACNFSFAVEKSAVDELQKQEKQMFTPTGQLNENCSATMIYSGRDDVSGDVDTVFLTAKHCVESQKDHDTFVDIPIYQDNRVVKKERYIARTRGMWWKGDLALVELKDKDTFFANTAKIEEKDTPMVMGEAVWTIGYPLAWSMTVTPGTFGGLETQDFQKPGTEYYRATPNIAGGNSGGGLHHKNADGDYRLIGVTTARSSSDSFIGLYTPLPAIYEYLEKALPEALPKADKEDTTKSSSN